MAFRRGEGENPRIAGHDQLLLAHAAGIQALLWKGIKNFTHSIDSSSFSYSDFLYTTYTWR